MKKRLLILALICVTFSTYSIAQIRFVPTASRSFSISAGGGAAFLYGDLKNKPLTPLARANFNYNLTSYISLGIEGQTGVLKANSIKVTGGDFNYAIENKIYAANINLKIAWGRIFGADPTNIVNGLYIGFGGGYLSQSITHNQTDSVLYAKLKSANPEFDFSREGIYVPVNIGLDIDLSTIADIHNLGININYQHNVVTHDYLDGLKTNVASNSFPDSYGFMSLAISYYFGKIRGN